MAYATIVCLVGENPLPIYLGIRHYADCDTRIVLLHTGEAGTKKQALSIADKVIQDKVILGKTPQEANQLVEIPTAIGAYDPVSIMRAMRKYRHSGTSLLNYTGGTKIMSSFAVLAWYNAITDREGLPRIEDAVYLEEESGGFRHPNGTLETLSITPPITLDDVVDIHTAQPHPHRAPVFHTPTDLCTLFDLRYIYYAAPAKVDAKGKVFDAITEWPIRSTEAEFNKIKSNFDQNTKLVIPGSQWHRFITTVFEPQTQGRWLATSLPDNLSAYKNWNDPSNIIEHELAAQVGFARSKWLEHYVYALLRSLGTNSRFDFKKVPSPPLIDPSSIYYEQQFLMHNKFFESDVIALYNNRVRYISVTTSTGREEVRSKCFEAIHRARQIGGGLASSCVICLLNEKESSEIWLSAGGDKQHRIFGRSDVNRWQHGEISRDFFDWLTK